MAIMVPNYPKVHPFFQRGTRAWYKDQVESTLPLDSLQLLKYEGLCFPKAHLKHQDSRVFPILNRMGGLLKSFIKTKTDPNKVGELNQREGAQIQEVIIRMERKKITQGNGRAPGAEVGTTPESLGHSFLRGSFNLDAIPDIM